MYLGVDIGGTKTLVAVLNGHGEIKSSQKFPTPPDYQEFLKQLADVVAKISTEPFKAACVAAPGRIDDKGRYVVAFGNLTWSDTPLLVDCRRIFHCPVVVENDAKLAGLSEAKLIKKDFKKVLYITISTGIGYSLIINGVIDQNMADGGGRTIMLERGGKVVPWESFASGSAIVKRYDKKASEINDPKIWQAMAGDFALGVIDLVAVMQPEVIVIGGGVGAHFKKFEKPLKEILKSYETPMMPIPKVVQAKHAEEAVIYGCYDLLKDVYGKATD